jgi:hypothetical protein
MGFGQDRLGLKTLAVEEDQGIALTGPEDSNQVV